MKLNVLIIFSVSPKSLQRVSDLHSLKSYSLNLNADTLAKCMTKNMFKRRMVVWRSLLNFKYDTISITLSIQYVCESIAMYVTYDKQWLLAVQQYICQ